MTNLGIRSETVEFKEGKKQFDKGVRALTAMLNSFRGGTVYFGVSETGDVIGLDLCDAAAERIRESVSTYIRPTLEPKIEVLKSDDGLQFISVSATSGYAVYSFDDSYYIRDGLSNIIASPEELVRLIMSYSKDNPDETLLTAPADTLNQNHKKVLKCLKKNSTMKLADVSAKTGISLSSVKKAVSELEKRDLLENRGTNRNSVWILK